VDVERFHHHPLAKRGATRAAFGIEPDALVLGSVSRLVPRKGMDVLIRAAALLAPEFPELRVVIAGAGRDLRRLERLASVRRAPVRFVGRVPDRDLPAFVGSLDVFAMMCRNRWAGLEQEGFGIVFLEASACGVAAVAGMSGGAAEAVLDGVTGRVVVDPTDPEEVADAIAPLLRSPELRTALGVAGRRRAVEQFSYDVLAHRLFEAISKATS
jgi:phosphatidylinositol alpha-1,6-mannosyltransferase